MPKRVAVVDLGSNSIRLVIFERTSRLGFYILAEHKIKARLGEGAYEHGGVLQEAAIKKCLNAFLEFKKLIKNYGAMRVLCVGTSALRDAPNGNEFINLVRKHTGISIRRIDGENEAYYGGVAALNLLDKFEEAITVDIGGGSTELAHIKAGKVQEKISLNLGTVRLKELFFDRDDINGAKNFIETALEEIPANLRCKTIIAVGGSLRAIGNAIAFMQHHPIKLIHNFCYDYEKEKFFIEKLANAKSAELTKFPIKKERYDTIREGALIFAKIAKKLGANEIITSGVGVREGVFLSSILGRGMKFDDNFNPSLKSLQDRFMSAKTTSTPKFVKQIFDALQPLHRLDITYLRPLTMAAKLCDIGMKLGFYQKAQSGAYLVLNGLNYRISHADKALVGAIICMHGKRDLGAEFYYLKPLLPSETTLCWLSFMLELARILNENKIKNLDISYENSTLRLANTKDLLMLRDTVKKLQKPTIFAINFS